MIIAYIAVIALAILVIYKDTCYFDNHVFKIQKKVTICQKCGIIKRNMLNDE